MPDHQVPLLQLEKQNSSAGTHGLPSFPSTGGLTESRRGLPCMGNRGREGRPFPAALTWMVQPWLPAHTCSTSPCHPGELHCHDLSDLTVLGLSLYPPKPVPRPLSLPKASPSQPFLCKQKIHGMWFCRARCKPRGC